MSPVSPNRRRLLSLAARLPALPLSRPLGAATFAALTGAGCSALPAGTTAVRSVRFAPMPAPSLADAGAMATTAVGSTMHVELADGSRVEVRLGYQPFFVTGDMVPDGRGGRVLAGGYFDIHNKPIIDATVPGKERQFFSDAPDGTSLLAVPGASVPGVRGNPVFAVVQFEYTTQAQDRTTKMYGRLPSQIAVLTLDQDPATGRLSLVKYHNVDTSSVHGLWITCGASLSPWGTHLSSEEYEPDAFTAAGNAQFKSFSRNLYGSETAANPYLYAHIPEVTVHPDGTGSIRKHYCMGRISHELVQVMPDNRTVVMGDDATNGGMFVFVADRERDLSSGTLYVARLGPGFSIEPSAAAASLSWIRLGSATSAEIEAMARKVKPNDILTLSATDPGDPAFRKVNVNGKTEWIRVTAGMEKAAAFLETHRYAAWVGATMGFSKMEGTTVNARDRIAYLALQNCIDSMVVGGTGHTPGNGIALSAPLNAGVVLALSLRGGQRDSTGAAIDSGWMPADVRTLLAGRDIASDALGNTADPERIANPDNLKFSEAMRTLFIGEDSAQHVNNFVWAYNVDTGALSRLMSMPAGAEATGLHAVDDLNGWSYILSNFQHAGDWGRIHAKVRDTLDPLIDAGYRGKHGAAVGYLTGTPRLRRG